MGSGVTGALVGANVVGDTLGVAVGCSNRCGVSQSEYI